MIKVTYDVPYKKYSGYSVYHAEHLAIREFHTSDHTNICFEYAKKVQAKNATQAILVWLRKNRMPMVVMQRENTVIVEKRS